MEEISNLRTVKSYVALYSVIILLGIILLPESLISDTILILFISFGVHFSTYEHLFKIINGKPQIIYPEQRNTYVINCTMAILWSSVASMASLISLYIIEIVDIVTILCGYVAFHWIINMVSFYIQYTKGTIYRGK